MDKKIISKLIIFLFFCLFAIYFIPNLFSESIDIKELYQTFKKTVVNPLDFVEEKNMDKIKECLKENQNLLEEVYNAHNFVGDDYNKLVILTLMKDILRLDIENLEALINKNEKNLEYWNQLHNKWYSELENWANKTFLPKGD